MRNIQFRGKKKDNGEWVYGYYSPVYLPIFDNQVDFINEGGYRAIEIDENTVGQSTGLNDKNGVEIYEKDIVETNIYYANLRVKGICEFRDGSFGVVWKRGDVETFTPFSAFANSEFEVIGNIFDNPELLEGDKR